MVRPAIQLYTIRDLEEPLTETLHRVADTGYEGVEFAGFGDESPEAIADALDDADLKPVGAHVGLDMLQTDYEKTVESYRILGCERIVIPSYGEDGFTSKSAVSEAANRLLTLADSLVDDGFEVHYHNHTYEFAELAGNFDTAYDAFAAQTDDRLGLEFDVGLARHGDIDPVLYLERYSDRISLIHLTDTIPGDDDSLHVDLGEGVIDLNACVRTAVNADAEWLIYENGLTTNPMETLTSSTARIQKLLDTA
ncbi:Sugar phosphate isomerase/epimerase [Haladaptatus litoreus]|uniref:Sugar phosphate isomerase/epimerase n=1 Tax=Haladaptatus litoreus TaxID=553468 RepID=A0A1N7DJ17_9EURY|nr:sugar phosphate isomerase/epimerase [Haladaptatus litoreus]SIR75798.1 Sugar phosphate isomerase/epimerase [Haladaptatus litoreus]